MPSCCRPAAVSVSLPAAACCSSTDVSRTLRVTSCFQSGYSSLTPRRAVRMQLNADVEFSFLATRRVTAWRPTAAIMPPNVYLGSCPLRRQHICSSCTVLNPHTTRSDIYLAVCQCRNTFMYSSCETLSMRWTVWSGRTTRVPEVLESLKVVVCVLAAKRTAYASSTLQRQHMLSLHSTGPAYCTMWYTSGSMWL